MATEAGRNSIGVRVRPNADGFINDLRTDLQSKKYTFYVDIKAKTQGATRDVKQWAATELREVNAKVYVSANMSRASGDVSAWRQRQAGIKTQLHVTANTFEANREVAAWRAIAGRDLEIKVKANISGKLTEVERIRKAVAQESKMTVRGDTSKVKQDVKKGIDDATQQLSMFTIDVDAKTNKARFKVNDFIGQMQGEQAELDLGLDTTGAEAKVKELKAKVKRDNPRAQVLLETSEARRDLAKLKLEAYRKKLVLDVDVKTNKWARFNKQVEKWEKGFGGGTVIRSLDFGPLNLGKPTGMLGTITQITAFAGLVPGLVTGVAALSDMFVRLAGSVSMLPGLLASIGSSFGTFAVGAFGFVDALDAMFKVWTEPTDRIERNQRNTIKWTNDLSKALANEKQAQRAVGDARRDATNELRNLNNELRGSVLNEAQAILDLQRAKDRLAQGDFENNTERMQAQLDVAKAEQNIIDVRERNVQLQQKVGQKQQQGVEQSDQVTQAMEQQARATEAVALAMQSIAMANPMGAQSLFEDAMDRLSPKARAAVEAIGGLRSEITTFQRGLQDVMFDGIAEKITGTFQNLAPIIEPGMTAIAQGLNQNILQIFDTLNSPDGKSIIERILGGTAEAQQMLGGLIDPLIRGFGTLMAAGAEHMPQLVQLFTQLADRFALFIEQADNSGALDKFLDEGITALSNLAELGINVVQIINDFSNAFRSAFGTDVLTKLVQITDKWHEFLSSEEGQKRLNGYIEDAKNLWNDWKPILEKLPEIFDKVQNIAMRFLDIFLPALNGVVSVLEKAPGLVEAFAGAWIGAKMLGAGKGIVEFGKMIWGVGTSVVNLATSFGTLLARIGPYLGPLSQFLGITRTTGAGANGFLLPGSTPTGVPGGAPGVIAAGAGAAANVIAPTLIGSWLSNVINGTDMPLLQQIGMGFKQPVRWMQDMFGDGSDTTHIAKANEKLKGVKVGGEQVPTYNPEGHDAAQAVIGKMVQAGSPAGRWVAEADSNVEQSRRYTWLFTQPNAQDLINDPNFVPPTQYPSYKKGGLTDWPRGVGKNAMLHGQEFVLPADSVDFYGKDFMEALRQRKLNFSEGGPVYDPTTGRYVDPETNPVQHGTTPHGLGQQSPGILNSIAAGVTGIVNNAATQATTNLTPGLAPTTPAITTPMIPTPGTGTGPLPGPTPPGVGTGPLPGPATPGTPAVNEVTDPKPLTMNIGGLTVPIGAGIPTGWPTPDGLPPVGLGRDGFDIRNFGIGHGPAGSTPGDWLKWTTDFVGATVTSLGSSLLGGFLGMFGLEGAMSNPYITSALGLGKHFLEAANGDKTNSVQAAGADQNNAQVQQLIELYRSMPVNPVYPGVPGALPPGLQPYFPGYNQQFPMAGPLGQLGGTPGQGFIPAGTELGPGNIAGSEAGLQRDAIAARRVISATFPFLQEIGGYRQDALDWHPSGRALDVMIPGSTTDQGKALGDTITQYALQNAQELNIDHVIWRGVLYPADGSDPRPQPDNGNWAANHMDHPHIAFKGAGMPDANTKYFAPSTGIIQYGLNEQGYPVPIGFPTTAALLPSARGTYTKTPNPIQPYTSGKEKPGGISATPAAQAATAAPGTGSNVNVPKADSKSSASTLLGNLLTGGGSEQTPPAASSPATPARNSSTPTATPKQVADKILRDSALAYGMPESELSAFIELAGDKTAIDILRTKYEFDPDQLSSKAVALAKHITANYEKSPVKALNQFRAKHTFRSGGAVWGQGSATSDSIPALLSNGEHVLTAKEVDQLGGQDGVYAFRAALNAGLIGGFAWGGAIQALVPKPKPPAPAPPPPPPIAQGTPVEPKPMAPPPPSPIEQPPQPTVGSTPPGENISPAAAPEPAPPAPEGGPQADPVTDQASPTLQSVGPGAPNLDVLHPAISTGIQSGAAAVGNLVSTAVSAAAAGASMGASSMGGGMGGQLASSLIGGAFQQGGKIAEGVLNAGANFLVGNITGGTTSNAYGVRQVANQPSGGTKIYDASTSIGSIHTSDLDEYYRMENRRQAQRAQSGLGHWGNR